MKLYQRSFGIEKSDLLEDAERYLEIFVPRRGVLIPNGYVPSGIDIQKYVFQAQHLDFGCNITLPPQRDQIIPNLSDICFGSLQAKSSTTQLGSIAQIIKPQRPTGFYRTCHAFIQCLTACYMWKKKMSVFPKTVFHLWFQVTPWS